MSSINTRHIAIGLACLAAGVGLWYLSQDKEATKYDPKKHTVEELRKLVKELFIADATIYCQKLVFIHNLKKSGELTQEVLDNFRHAHRQELEEVEQEIYEAHNIDEFFVQDWLSKFKTDPEISAMFKQLENFEESVFNLENPMIPHLKRSKMPSMPTKDGQRKDMDENMYVQIFRKKLAVFRHKIYMFIKQSGGATNNPDAIEARNDGLKAI